MEYNNGDDIKIDKNDDIIICGKSVKNKRQFTN